MDDAQTLLSLYLEVPEWLEDLKKYRRKSIVIQKCPARELVQLSL